MLSYQNTYRLGVVISLLWGPLSARPFDLIIRGGAVVDGTGAPRLVEDVGVVGDAITAVGNLSGQNAAVEVDARGKIVTPGFIDMHVHLDDESVGQDGLRSSDPLIRAAQNYVTQGVTTGLVNPDGYSVPSLIGQRRDLMKLGIGVNVALLTGHNTLRELVMGKDVRRPATAEEIRRMQDILRHQLEAEGSFGLSLGLEYFSGLYSNTEELVGLARILPPYNGIFTPHLRSQGIAPMWYRPSVDGDKPPATLADAVSEVIRVAEETGCIADFTHFKARGPGFRGLGAEWIARIEEARKRGARIYMSVYPYDSAASDGQFVALPNWAIGLGRAPDNPEHRGRADFQAALKATLADPAKRADLEHDVNEVVALDGGTDNIRILDYPDRSTIGKSLSDLMAERKLGLTDLAIALQIEGNPNLPGGAKMRSFSMDERDIETFYRQPWCATCSDGRIVLPEKAVGVRKYFDTHQRCFGTFPRRIAVYSQELQIDPLEEAVRKCTGLPADILNLRDRGRILPGCKADLAVIDLSRLRDNTTVMEPSVYASGVDFVFVNGVAVVSAGTRTLALPGRVLDPAGRPVAAALLSTN